MKPPKLLRTVAFSILTFLFAVAMGVTTSYAQTTYYVDTGGNNTNNGLAPSLSGSDGPVETITHALSLASDGDIISIEAGNYAENVTVGKTVSFVARTTGTQTVVNTQDLTINGSGKTLTFTANGANTFSVDDIYLTQGNIVAGTDLVTTTGGDIFVGNGTTAGTLTGTIDFPTNVNVNYNVAADYTTGDELPADLGSGSLIVETRNAGTALDLTKDVTVAVFDLNDASGNGDGVIGSSIVTVNASASVDLDDSFTGNLVVNATAGNAPGLDLAAGKAITGDVTISQADTDNGASGIGSIAFNGNVTGEVSITNAGDAGVLTTTIAGAATLTGDLTINNTSDVGGTGAVAGNGDIVGNVSLTSTTGDIAFNLAGMVDGNVDLDGALDLAANAEVTGTVTTGNDITTSGAGAEIGDLVVTGSNAVASVNPLVVTNDITINSGTMTTGNSVTATNVTINSGNGLDISGQTLTLNNGSFINDQGTFTATAASVLSFTGTTAAATLTPGSNFSVGAITMNKSGQALTLTDDASLSASGAAALTVTAGTFNLQDNTLTIAADGQVTNTTNGTIVSDTPTEGGLYFTTPGATLAGSGYSNIILNTGAAANNISLNADVTFSGNLTFISGTISGGAFDISPTQANQQLTINPQLSDGVTGGASFNDAGLAYDIKYDGAITANQTIGAELTSDVRNVTISTTGAFSVIMPSVDIAMVNLTIEDGATLQAAGAAQSNEISGVLTIEEDGTLLSDAATASDFELSGNNQTHDVSGAVVDGGTRATFTVSGDNITVAGSGEEDANNNYAVADFTVTGSAATISGFQSMGALTVNGGTSTAAVTVDLIATDEAAPNASTDYGVIDGAVTTTVAGDAVTISSATQANGALSIADDSDLTLAGNNLVINGADITIGGADATVSSTGGALVFTGGTNLEANGATIPYLSVLSPATSTSALVVSEALTVEGNITGGGVVTLEGAEVTTDDVTIADLEIDGDTELITNSTASPTVARTITVTGTYTHTSGDIELNKNSIQINTNLSLTAGAYTSSTGTGGIIIDATAAGRSIITGGANVSIPNLTVQGTNNVTLTSGDVLTVQNGLTLNTALLVPSGDSEDVVIADGATITRTENAHTIAVAPTFEGSVDLVYNNNNATAAGADVISTGNEVPAAAAGSVNDVTVVSTEAADQLAITTAFDVNGNFSITGTTVDNSGANLTFVAGSSIELEDGVADFAAAIDTDSEDYTVIFRTSRTIDTDTPDNYFAGDNFSITVDNEAASTITGTLAANSDTFGDVEIGENDAININTTQGINIQGDLDTESAAFFTTDGTNTITFNGTGVQNVNFGGNYQVAEGDALVFNAENVYIQSGNITFADGSNNAVDPHFQTGVVWTGDNNYIQLVHTSTTDQGFDRTDGHVFGNVRKLLPAGSGTSERIIFPVGGNNQDELNGAPEDEYSPVAFTFTNTNSLPQGIYMTVGHEEGNPGGQNGFPIVDGVREGVNIVRYPDEFYWPIKTSASLPSNLTYELEMERQGYGEYTQDGAITDVEDIRIIRRAAGNVDNDWRLQGNADDYDNYQTGSVENGDIYPTVIGLNVQGGIQAGNGSIFTYGLKSNLEILDVDTLLVNAGNNLAFDLDSLFSGGTGDRSYDISVDDATVATADADGDTLNIAAGSEGVANFTITATDELGDSNTGSLTVKVNAAFVASIDDQVANVGDTLAIDLTTVYSGGSAPYTFTASSSADSVAEASVDSVTLEMPALTMGNTTISVVGVDASNDTVNVSFTLNVGGVFGTTGTMNNVVVRAGDDANQAAGTVSVDTLASFFAGGSTPYTFTAASSAEDSASVSVSNDTLTVTGEMGSIDPQPITITVTAEDATGATAEQTFEVTVNPAYGDVNADGTVNSSDASLILSAAIEEVDFTAAQEGAADVNENGTVNSFDASVTFRYFLEDITELPFSTSAKVDQAIVAYGKTQSTNGSISVPLNVEGSAIYAVDFIGSFDASAASLESIDFNGLPEDWMVVKSIDEGKVKFALAGSTPISGRQFATLTFSITDEYAETSFSGKGFANNSEYLLDELNMRATPQEFALEQNYPNPFNPTTTVSYALPSAADVTIELYSINGQKVQTLVSKRQDAGAYKVNVDGSRLASGVYIYRIQAKAENKSFTTTRKMTLIK